MLKIICVGKIKKQYIKDAIKDYQTRLSKYTRVELIELDDDNMKDEAKRIIKHLDDKSYIITLEIEGKQLSSKELSDKIKELNTYGDSNITFVIGGSDGLDDSIKQKRNMSLSFSKMTFPHQLFRVLLLEQLYRAYKIINNEQYHK